MKTGIKRALKWLSISACAAALACAALLVWIHTGPGKSAAADFLSGVLSGGGRSVKITGLDVLLPNRLGFENLAVSDENGEWLLVDDAFLRWDAWSVVRGRIHVRDVGARSITISRVPESTSRPSKGEPGASGKFPWELLTRVSISSAFFESISIEEAVAGAAMRFRLQSSFSPETGGEDAVFRLDAERLDGPGGHARITVSLNPVLRTLAVDGHLLDPEGGVVSTLMGKPVPVDVSISGAGPFSTWKGSLDGHVGDLAGLRLHVTLTDREGAFRVAGGGEIAVLSGLTGRPEPDLIGLAFDADVSETRRIHVRDFQLVHPGATFISTGTFDPSAGSIAASFSLGIPEAGTFFNRKPFRMEGGVEIAGDLTGTVNRPVLATEVIGTAIASHDVTADRVTGKIRAVLDREPQGWGALDVKADASGSGVIFPGGVSLPGDEARLEADMRVTADGAVSGMGKATLGTGLHASFSGNLSSGRAVEAAGRIEAKDLSVLAGVAGVPLAGASELGFSLAGPTAGSFSVTFEGSAEPVLLSRLTGQSWPGGNLRLKGSLSLDETRNLRVTDLVLADDAFRLSGGASMVFPEQSFSGAVDLKIPELARFSSFSGTALSGSADFRAGFEGKAGSVSADAEGELSNLYAGGFRVDHGTVGVSARGRLPDMKGELSVDLTSGGRDFHLGTGVRSNPEKIDFVGLLFNGPGAVVEGNIGLSHETKFITGDLNYHIEDPGRFLETRLEGKGTGSIRFFDDGKDQKALVEFTASQVEAEPGSIARIRAEGEATGLFPPRRAAVTCEVSGLEAGRLRVSTATLEGEMSGPGVSVDVELAGRFHSDFSSGLSASLTGGPERILTVSRFNHVHGGVPVGLDSPLRIAFAGPKISTEEASFAVGKGTLRASGMLDRDASRFSLEASYRRLPLALASALGFDAGDGLVSGKGTLSTTDERPVLALDVLVEGFDFPGGGRDFPTLDADLRVAGDGNRIEGSGEIRGAGETPLTLKFGVPLAYGSSSTFPRLAPTGAIEGRLAWNFDIQDVQEVGVRMPGDLSGKAGLKIDIHGTAENPEFSGELRVSDGGYRDIQAGNVIENLGLDLSARTLPGGPADRLAVAGTLSGLASSPFEIAAELPFGFSLSPFRFTFPPDGAVKGSLRGEMDLAAVPAAFSLDRQDIQGLVQLDFDLAGTVVEPRVSGSARLNGGYFEDITTGTVLEDISLDLEASPPRIRIARCEARAGQDGKVEAAGWLDLVPGEAASYDVTLKMEDAALLRRDDAYAVMDGSIRLRGAGSEALVTGKMLLERAEIRIPDHAGIDIPQLEVVEIHRDGTVEAPASSSEAEAPPSLPVDVDVKLDSPGRLFVAGRGLDSEWKGSIHVTGKSPEMEVAGGFSLVRGHFNLLGKRFTLTTGTITLGGLAGAPPLVDVAGKASSGDMTAEVKISGPATAPEIHLSSDPPYPSDEILSRLLFEKSLDTLTPLQALQLAQALRTLSGGGGPGLFDKTRKLLGVDQLELMQSDEDEGEAAIRAGKYIHDRIYFQVEQGVGSDSSRASVEVELSPNLSLETEVGADSGGGVGVKWRWDY